MNFLCLSGIYAEILIHRCVTIFICELAGQEACFDTIWFYIMSGREIAPNTGANATKFFTLATKS